MDQALKCLMSKAKKAKSIFNKISKMPVLSDQGVWIARTWDAL